MSRQTGLGNELANSIQWYVLYDGWLTVCCVHMWGAVSHHMKFDDYTTRQNTAHLGIMLRGNSISQV